MRPESRNLPGLAEALPALVSSVSVDPSPRNVMRVSEALWLAGQPAQAIGFLEPLVAHDDLAIAPRVLLLWCYEALENADEAERTRKRIRELDPANPFARGHGGTSEVEPGTLAEPPPTGAETEPGAWEGLERQAEPETALTEEELREVPPGPLYSVTLAEIFEKQGFEEKAIEIYRQILEHQPQREDLVARIQKLESRAAGDAYP